MLSYTEGDITLDEVKIHYYRTGGKKPPLILIHGMSDNGLCWGQTAEWLAERYDVIMPDTQGHGLSDRIDQNFTFESHAQQTAGLSLGLGLNKPIIMGHSLGGGTAAQIAINYPSLPRAIILEDPGLMPAPAPPLTDGRARQMAEDFRRNFIDLQKKTITEILAEGRAANPGWPEDEFPFWAESKLQFDPTLLSKETVNPDLYKEAMPQIKCSTLLIIAEKGLVAPEVAKDAAKLWQSKNPFKWVMIKGAGHSIRRENFVDYQAAVADFLKNLPAK
jgi:N-formylmaleamate deformylase